MASYFLPILGGAGGNSNSSVSASYAATASVALTAISSSIISVTQSFFTSSVASAIYTPIPFIATWGHTLLLQPISNILTEIDPNLRIRVDLTNAVSASLSAYVTQSLAGAQLIVQYAPDELTWNNLAILNISSSGAEISPYIAVPGNANGIQALRLVSRNGDNSSTVELGNVSVGLIQSAIGGGTVISGSALSSSYAQTASFIQGTISTASLANTASFTISASYALTASWSAISNSASYAGTASLLLGNIVSASYAITASTATSLTFQPVSASYAITASYASQSQYSISGLSSSYATTASFALNAGSGGGGQLTNGIQALTEQINLVSTFGQTIIYNPLPVGQNEVDGNIRTTADLSFAVSTSLAAYVTQSAVSGNLQAQYSTNGGTTWTTLNTLNLTASNQAFTPYVAVPGDAQQICLLRLITVGDGSSTVELGNVELNLIQQAPAVTASYALTSSLNISSSYALTCSFALNGGGGSGVSSSYAGTASVAQNVTVISGSGNFLTSSIVIQPGWVGGYVFLNPNTSSLSVNLPTHSIGAAYIIYHDGIAGSLTVADNNNVTQSLIVPTKYNTFVDTGLAWKIF